LALSSVTATQLQTKNKVLFLLDEFAQLGYMQQIEDAVSLVRGYGAQFWIFFAGFEPTSGSVWQMANFFR